MLVIAIIVFGFLLLVFSEYGSWEEPLSETYDWAYVIAHTGKISLLVRMFSWLLPWREVIDPKNRLWVYKVWRGRVFVREPKGLFQMTQKQYDAVFGKSPCCDNEKRNMQGGCDSCGDPCL